MDMMELQVELLDAARELDDHHLVAMAELGVELGGQVGVLLQAASAMERGRRDGVPALTARVVR